MPYFSNPLPWALDILITDSFSYLNNKANKERYSWNGFILSQSNSYTSNQSFNYSRKFKIKYQNGNSGKNITLKIIDFTFFETSE